MRRSDNFAGKSAQFHWGNMEKLGVVKICQFVTLLNYDDCYNDIFHYHLRITFSAETLLLLLPNSNICLVSISSHFALNLNTHTKNWNNSDNGSKSMKQPMTMTFSDFFRGNKAT